MNVSYPLENGPSGSPEFILKDFGLHPKKIRLKILLKYTMTFMHQFRKQYISHVPQNIPPRATFSSWAGHRLLKAGLLFGQKRIMVRIKWLNSVEKGWWVGKDFI